MILPIVAYGHPILKKIAEKVQTNDTSLLALIDNMFATMYHANGVGLAAPQVGLSIRLFVVDASPFADEESSLLNFKMVFINPEIIEETGESWSFNEGCLSIPSVRENIIRKKNIKIRYQDEHFVQHEKEFQGIAARIIQHEYDHLQGILFVDKVKGLRREMIKGKLQKITQGKIDADYKMKFVK